MNIDEARISQVCTAASLRSRVFLRFFDLFNFFSFALFSSWWRWKFHLGKSRLFPLIEAQTSVRFERELDPKNVRNLRIGSSGEEQKDIKLKVVKTSSRFSIYFQLHFALLLGVFANVFLSVTRNTQKMSKSWKSDCVNAACFPRTKQPKRRESRKPNKIIYCFSICEILFDYNPNSHISIIFFPFLRHPIFLHVHSRSGLGWREKGKYLLWDFHDATSFSCRKI